VLIVELFIYFVFEFDIVRLVNNIFVKKNLKKQQHCGKMLYAL